MTLKHTPCDCAEWRRLNEACADLMAERDQALDSLRARDSLMVAFKEEAERERDEAQSERDALRKDAERYRWLRDNAAGKGYLLNVWQGYELDGAIDAAMQEATNA